MARTWHVPRVVITEYRIACVPRGSILNYNPRKINNKSLLGISFQISAESISCQMLWQVAILFGGWTVFGPDTNELGGLDATGCDSIGRGLASTNR